jgi:hypothetical protein
VQETPVGWDPISVNHHLPWGARLFVLYLIVVLIISLVRSVSIMRMLWWRAPRGKFSLEGPDSERKTDMLVDFALANRLPDDATSSKGNAVDLLVTVRRAGGRFLYLWEKCFGKVASLKKLAILTFFFAFLTLASSLATVLKEIAAWKAVGIGFLAGNAAEEVGLFALGIFACAELYALWAIWEGLLARRKAAWNYFCAKIRGLSET